jgi:flagellar hook assembly protein FlgD
MSVIFWALTTELTDRSLRGERVTVELDDDDEAPAPAVDAAVSPLRLRVAPNPARGSCALTIERGDAEPVSLAIYDAGGRLVRRLDVAARASGIQVVRWDGRDSSGRAVPNGPYFARLRAGARETTERVVWIGR